MDRLNGLQLNAAEQRLVDEAINSWIPSEFDLLTEVIHALYTQRRVAARLNLNDAEIDNMMRSAGTLSMVHCDMVRAGILPRRQSTQRQSTQRGRPTVTVPIDATEDTNLLYFKVEKINEEADVLSLLFTWDVSVV